MKAKYRLTLALFAILGLFAFTGCASTIIKDSSVQKRTVSLNVLGIIQFEKSTEGLAIGEAELVKKEEEETE